MIKAAHAIVFTTDADADRAFFRDVLQMKNIDVGGGWLIFQLPPAEVAFHPNDRNDVHELYLVCDSLDAFMAKMAEHGVACTEPKDEGWGVITSITLPGGGKLGVYEARHALAHES